MALAAFGLRLRRSPPKDIFARVRHAPASTLIAALELRYVALAGRVKPDLLPAARSPASIVICRENTCPSSDQYLYHFTTVQIKFVVLFVLNVTPIGRHLRRFSQASLGYLA